MAEFAAASGAAGLVSLGLEVTKGLVQYCQASKGCAGDMAALSDHLESFSDILEVCHFVLARYGTDEDTPARKSMERALVACAAGIKTLGDVWKKYQPPQSGADGTLRARLHRASYAFRKDEIASLNQALDRMQANLHTAMQANAL